MEGLNFKNKNIKGFVLIFRKCIKNQKAYFLAKFCDERKKF